MVASRIAGFHSVSPADWGLELPPAGSRGADEVRQRLGIGLAELRSRWEHATSDWLMHQLDPEEGAFCGTYFAVERRATRPNTANLIAPLQLLAVHDLTPRPVWLETAASAARWLAEHLWISHPMSIVQGGLMPPEAAEELQLRQMWRLPGRMELWVKYTAEFVTLNLALWRRTGDPLAMDRARRSAGFLVQARRHDGASAYDMHTETWTRRGWLSYGRCVEAALQMFEATGAERWLNEAIAWGERLLRMQHEDGGLYLIDGEYFNTDLAADELRALVFLFEQTRDSRFLDGATSFSRFLRRIQRPDGAWPLTVDVDGNVVCDVVGPGDVPNVGISLLRLHHHTGDPTELDAAVRAFRYSLSTQVLPESGPLARDPRVCWGFWSWDPVFDHSLSGDQSTHHVRGWMFAAAYLGALAGDPVWLDPRAGG